MRPLNDRPYLLLTLAVFFWAGNFILGRAFHNEIPPIALAFWRWVGAALLVTVPSLPHFRRDYQALYRAWPAVLLLALLGIAAFNTLAYSGLQYTEAINAFLLQSLMPVLIVLFSFIAFREKVTKLQSLGILVSLFGAVMIIVRGDVENLLSLSVNRGDLLVFTAIACYAGYTVMLRKRPTVHPMSFLFTIFWIGSIALVPLYIWENMTVARMTISPASLLVIGYVMVFPSIVSYLCYNRGVELVGANRAGLFIHLMPVFGSVMAVLFLGEVFAWYHSAGIVLIAMGIYLATRK